MDSNKLNKRKLLFYIILLTCSIYLLQIVNLYKIPSEVNIFEGGKKDINLLLPFTINNKLNSKNNILRIENNKNNSKFNTSNRYSLKSKKIGSTNLNIELLGLFPVKTVQVNIMDRIKLQPGGQSIGVKLKTEGVLIVALSDIKGKDGENHTPGIESGLKIGDSILEINDIKVKDSYHVIDLLNDIQDSKIKLKIKRNEEELIKHIVPIKSKEDGIYRIGLWVRDKTAGIGTLTFYDKKTKKFAALGHGISDIDTGKLMNISGGEILEASISSIEQGTKGHPGELKGMFFESQNLLGNIEKNTSLGIYGTINKEMNNSYYKDSIPIALQHEVKKGKAYILSTIGNKDVNKYEVEIVKKETQANIAPKSMTIKITDKKLLSKTGGIVQGMSGSPIIQDGKIIGAITHVFVNDPTKGYGLYIEWMLEESGILKNDIGMQKIRDFPYFFC
ncbi:SpoIVB peptidase [Senegalia massiliensis]|uniref:SpoIVB peptidase n=1 Tax=Senegalia massiliensis TaxID=1720316 RepID=UPI0010326E1A|nr:SpoIVB peptidase [Senegalia massiliensis]